MMAGSRPTDSAHPVGLFRPPPGLNVGPVKRLTEAEAQEKAIELLSEWRPKRDVWTMTYGTGLPACLAAAPAIVLTNDIRRMMKAHRLPGRLLIMFPATLLPSMSSLVSQYAALQDILVAKTACPVCLEMRTIGLQLTAGTGCSTLLALVGNYYLLWQARARGLPREGLSEVLKWARRVLQRNSFFLASMVLAQAVTTSGVLYFQRRQWLALNKKLTERMHEEVESRERT